MKTREEALRQAKLEMVMCGGFDRIGSRAGLWFDKVTGNPLTQDEGLALIPDDAVDEIYVRQIMAQGE